MNLKNRIVRITKHIDQSHLHIAFGMVELRWKCEHIVVIGSVSAVQDKIILLNNATDGHPCMKRFRHSRGIMDTDSEVHLRIGVCLVARNRDYRRRVVVDRGVVDGNIVKIQVPAIVADALEDDEAVVVRAVEGKGVLVPVVHIGDDRLHEGATVYGAQQLTAFRARHRVVIHIDAVGAVDVRVAVAEDPEADDVVVLAQFHLGCDQLGGATCGVGVGVESCHILALVMRCRARRGAFRDTVEGVIAICDVVLPTERHKVVLEAFHQREVSVRCQSRDLEVSALCRGCMARDHVESGMNNFVVTQVHRQGCHGGQLHRAVVGQVDLVHLSAVLIERHRQVTGAVELVGVGFQARIVEAETQVGRFAEIDRGVGGELLDVEVVLSRLLDDDIVDRQIPRPIVGHAMEAYIERA